MLCMRIAPRFAHFYHKSKYDCHLTLEMERIRSIYIEDSFRNFQFKLCSSFNIKDIGLINIQITFMGNSASDDQKILKSLSGQYLLEENPYLFHKRTNQPCVLHKIITNTHAESDYIAQIIDQYAKTRCQSISQLKTHQRVDNTGYCSDEQIFYLIFQGRNNVSLKQELAKRKLQHESFKEQEILHVLQTYLCGLREYSQRFHRNFERLNLDSISIDERTRKLTLKDPWLVANNSNSLDTFSQMLTTYPSPEKLGAAYGSKLNTYDQSSSNLFSLGVISLEMHNLGFVDSLYSKKKEVNVEEVRVWVRKFKNETLRRGVECLLSVNPNERKKIYQIWGVENEEEHFLATTNTPVSTDRELRPQKYQSVLQPVASNHSVLPQNPHQTYTLQRVNSQPQRKNSPPATFLPRIEEPPKRGFSVGIPAPLKISFNDQGQRLPSPKQPTSPSNINAISFPKTDSPYNAFYYYQNTDRKVVNDLPKNNNVQIQIQPPSNDRILSNQPDISLTKTMEKKLNPISQQKPKNTLIPPKGHLEKNSQTPKRPTNKFKHNSTIVQAREEDSVDRSAKSEEPGDKEYAIDHYEAGSRYEGFKSKGMRNGLGKFYYQDGGYYEGHWKNNKMDGYGKLYYFGGKLAYEGNWIEDQFNGTGKVYNDNAAKLSVPFDYTNFDLLQDYWQFYQGNLCKDTKQGRGKIMLSNGEYFEGDFHNDRIQGLGKFYTHEGKVIEGIWKESKLLKVMNNS